MVPITFFYPFQPEVQFYSGLAPRSILPAEVDSATGGFHYLEVPNLWSSHLWYKDLGTVHSGEGCTTLGHSGLRESPFLTQAFLPTQGGLVLSDNAGDPPTQELPRPTSPPSSVCLGKDRELEWLSHRMR